MISFKDYLTQLEKIHCGIARNSTRKQLELFEDLHVEPYSFIISKKDEAKYAGDMHSPGILKVTKFGQGTKYLAHREVGSDPIEFSDPVAASQFSKTKWKHQENLLKVAHATLMAHYRPTHQKYETVLSRYGNGSTTLNHTLLTSDEVPEQALKLDHALHHNNTPDDMVVYSGISPSHATKVALHSVVHHPAFLSTSLRMSTAQSFSLAQGSNDILKIHVPANHPGAYIGDLSGHNSHEKEFLLPRNLKLRIHRDKEMISKSRMGDFTIHHCTIES